MLKKFLTYSYILCNMKLIFFLFLFNILNLIIKAKNCCYKDIKIINYDIKEENDVKEDNDDKKVKENVKYDNNDKKIKDLDDITKSIFESLATKKIFFNDEDRKNHNFKHFEFIKNMFPNGDNRCWLICEIIAFFNTPYFQEILLNNDFEDNKYLKSLKKLLLDCRSKNNKKQQLNCDEITKLIDDDINRNGRFESPLYQNNNFTSSRKDRKITAFTFKNFSEFSIKFKENITNIIDLNKIKNYDPILYSVKESLNFEPDICFTGDVNYLEYCNIPFQEDEKTRTFFNVMYIFSDKNTEDKFLEILKHKNKKKHDNVNAFYIFLESIFYEIKNNFSFKCNSIIMHSFEYHYFSFCKNFTDNNWYNFNSLDGKYGEICNETIDELIKNKRLTISGHEYIPHLFIISVSPK